MPNRIITDKLKQAAGFVGVELVFLWKTEASDRCDFTDGVLWPDKPNRENLDHLSADMGMALSWRLLEEVHRRPGHQRVEVELDVHRHKSHDGYVINVDMTLGFPTPSIA